MSINDITPQSLARHRQDVSPKKAELKSSHGFARHKINTDKDDANIVAQQNLDVNSVDYYDELMDET